MISSLSVAIFLIAWNLPCVFLFNPGLSLARTKRISSHQILHMAASQDIRNNDASHADGEILPSELQSDKIISSAERLRGAVARYTQSAIAAYGTTLAISNVLQANAADAGTEGAAVTAGASTAQSSQPPQITDKVYLNIRIANYTEESVGKNRAGAGSGRVVIGLYGNAAPKACKLFLDTVASDGSETPSYYNTQFTKVSEEGLLMSGKISRLNTVQLAGQEQFEYNGNIIPYEPFVESNGIPHDRPGLLSRKQLNRAPEFGITLRPASDLDGFHEVFGCILEGTEVLDAIAAIQTYTYTTGTGYASKEKGLESGLSDAWFEGQKKLFVGAGKAFGDPRAVDRRGKLLRRVTIKDSGRVR